MRWDPVRWHRWYWTVDGRLLIVIHKGRAVINGQWGWIYVSHRLLKACLVFIILTILQRICRKPLENWSKYPLKDNQDSWNLHQILYIEQLVANTCPMPHALQCAYLDTGSLSSVSINEFRYYFKRLWPWINKCIRPSVRANSNIGICYSKSQDVCN